MAWASSRGVHSAGTALPKGKAAIGWRIAVYWRDDKAFYPAEIMGYDTATGRHEVEYDDSTHLQALMLYHLNAVTGAPLHHNVA